MPPSTLRPSELPALPALLPPGVRTLSLDCFDTLLWRRVAQPIDVFHALQQRPAAQAAGLTAAWRAISETQARRRKELRTGLPEVTIDEIYRQALPEATAEQRQALCDAEFDCEAEAGFIHPRTLALIREAKARGLRVIIVSDTYWSAAELRRLLCRVMDDPDCAGIDAIHCSSELGRGKSAGGWKEVLRREGGNPAHLFHVGDHPVADAEAARQAGIGAAQLLPLDETTTAQAGDRLQAALQLMPQLRAERPVPSLFHGVLSLGDEQAATVADRIGHGAVGPILAAFAEFILQQQQALAARGPQVRTAFLMRDGHLPQRACEALAPGVLDASALHISRFAAIAASLRTQDDVLGVLASSLSVHTLDILARQLLLPPDMARQLVAQARRQPDPARAFANAVQQPAVLRTIFAQSQTYGRRLVAHVRSRTGVQPGERLMLVDLGYAGTVQTALAPVLKEALGVELFGAYLLARNATLHGPDRRALIDAHWADERLVVALTTFIGIFEKICALAAPSTEDYDDDGTPRAAAGARPRVASPQVEAMQAACLRFVAQWRDWPAACRGPADLVELGINAAADLGRLVYFPSPEETECLAGLQFDMNLGSSLAHPVIDLAAAAQEFRREGFAMLTHDFRDLRVGHPAELRHLDAGLSNLLLDAVRFGFALDAGRGGQRRQQLAVLLANRTQHALQEVTAIATHDGYHQLVLPLSASFDMSVLWGRHLRCIQLDAIQRLTLGTLQDAPVDLQLGRDVLLDQAAFDDDGLLRLEPGGMMYFPAARAPVAPGTVLRIVYRPLVERGTVPAAHPSPAADAAAPELVS